MMAEYKPEKMGTRCECGAPYVRAGINSGYGCASSVREAAYRLAKRRAAYQARKPVYEAPQADGSVVRYRYDNGKLRFV